MSLFAQRILKVVVFTLFSLTANSTLAEQPPIFEININPINGWFGNQYMYNVMYVVKPDVAFGPTLSFDRLNTHDSVDADIIKETAVGIRMERAPLGFDMDGYYSSIAIDVQSMKTQSDVKDCKGNFLGYGGTFLTGYTFRENPYHAVMRLGAGLHTAMYLNPMLNCDDGTKLNTRKATGYVTFTPILELSIGYKI